MKKTLAFALVIIEAMVMLVFTGCGKKEDTATETVAETITTEASTQAEKFEPVEIDMNQLVNVEANSKTIVNVLGDNEMLLSFDFSEMVTSKVEMTLDAPVNSDYLYVTMAGNVINHSLQSDGSLFDGIVQIVDGKAEFSIEYSDNKIVTVSINVPKS